MKTKAALAGLALILIGGVGVFLYCNQKSTLPNLQLLTEQGAGIHDFYVEEDKVYIVGGVTIKNNTDQEQTYTLYATSEYDYENGLIKSAKMQGYDETLQETKFTIKENGTETFTVVFVGDYAGSPQKGTRLMPEITIES